MSIPARPEELTPSWLSAVLQRPVRACQLLDAHSGTTGRALLAVEYQTGGTGPDRLFVKLPPADLAQRAFVTSSGMGRREAMFYRQLGPEVPLRVPHCYHADTDAAGENYIMLLENLDDSACTFRNASTRYSIDYMRAILSAFADLHSAYWNSSRFQTDLSWVAPPAQHDIAVKLIQRGLTTFGADMPPVFSEMAQLYLEHTDAIHTLWGEGDHTLVHGDVHDGNMFFDGDRPGFLDWAVMSKAPGMRDVGYFLAATLREEDRQTHERELIEYYRHCLVQSAAPAPPIDELWRQYQWHAAYVWLGTTVTLAMGDAWQPVNYTRKALDRLNRTLERLGTVSAIRAAL